MRHCVVQRVGSVRQNGAGVPDLEYELLVNQALHDAAEYIAVRKVPLESVSYSAERL